MAFGGSSYEPPPPGEQLDPIRAVPVRHPGRWVAAVFVVVLLAQVVHGVALNKAFHWGIVSDYLTFGPILHGVRVMLELTALSMVIGIGLGVLLAVMRLSANPLVSGAAWLFVYLFRGTPLLVQILFWYNIAAVFPTISLGIPFGPTFVSGNANDIITSFTAALLALGLNEGAYMSEIVRAGILSVDEGQGEAAAALGMSRSHNMLRIVLPQAMRVVIPPTGNETISMLKTTSLVSVISVTELLQSVEVVSSRNFQVIPLLVVALFWYLVASSVLYIGQYYLERRFARGSVRSLPPTPRQRAVRLLGLSRSGLMS